MLSAHEGMKQTLELLVGQYGRTVQFGAAETAVQAFLRPVTQASLQNLRAVFSDLGQIPQGTWIYIGPTEPALAEQDLLTADGARFRVRRAETLELGGVPLYRWGLLTKVGEPWTAS